MEKLPVNIDYKKFRKSTLGVKKHSSDPVLIMDDLGMDKLADNIRTLERWRLYWMSLSDFRNRRARSHRFHRGDQWSDYIIDPDDSTKRITEEQHILDQGKVPLKQNVIRSLMKSLIGQYITNPTSSIVISRVREKAKVGEMFTNAIQYVHQVNDGDQLDVSNFRELGMCGMPIEKITYEYKKELNREEIRESVVNPHRIFCNSDLEDPRGDDIRCIGEILDVPIDQVISKFARTPDQEKKLRELLNYTYNYYYQTVGFNADRIENIDFYICREPGKVRLFEGWELQSGWRLYLHDPVEGKKYIAPISLKDQVLKINQVRLQKAVESGMSPEEAPLIEIEPKKEQFWVVKILTSQGYLLFEGESPYDHEEHPYSFVMHPLTNGEVWGFVEDIIDQQKYINRLVTMIDFIIGASSKGTLFVPEDSIADDFDLDSIASEYSKIGGVIKIKIKPGAQVPFEISSQARNIGISELLSIQMKLIEEISGVQSAIQGKNVPSGTPYSLYAQQISQASLNNMEYMNSFNYFKKKRDLKILKLIKQYYKEKRFLALAGKDYDDEAMVYDPEFSDVETDLIITESNSTPVFRSIMDEFLMKLLDTNKITLEMMLENSSFPFADKLMESVKKAKMEAQQGMPINPQLPPELQQIAAQANPETMKMLNMG